jgi:hypothetical protein
MNLFFTVTGNTDVVHPGQINNSGDTSALFLKQFSGEVLTAFQQLNVTEGKVLERTITGGKSAQFPVTGVATAKYHTVGENILESSNGYISKIANAEKIINVDSELIGSAFLSSIEEAELHYEIRSRYATEIARELARLYDLKNLQVITKAARTNKTITDQSGYRPLDGGDTILAGSTVTTDATVLAKALFKASELLDNKSVNDGERYAAVSPALYNLLIQNKDAINKWWGGAGSYSDGTVFRIGGLTLVKTIHLPSTVITADATHEANDYSGDFTATKGLVWTAPASGVVKLKELKSEAQYFVNYRGTLLLSSYALGHGILRPECAVEISNASGS